MYFNTNYFNLIKGLNVLLIFILTVILWSGKSFQFQEIPVAMKNFCK